MRTVTFTMKLLCHRQRNVMRYLQSSERKGLLCLLRRYDLRQYIMLTAIGLLHPTGANDVLSYPLFVRDFFLSFCIDGQ